MADGLSNGIQCVASPIDSADVPQLYDSLRFWDVIRRMSDEMPQPGRIPSNAISIAAE